MSSNRPSQTSQADVVAKTNHNREHISALVQGRTPPDRPQADAPKPNLTDRLAAWVQSKLPEQAPPKPARLPDRFTDTQLKAAHSQASGNELKASTVKTYEMVNKTREQNGLTVNQAMAGLTPSAAANVKNAAVFQAKSELKAALDERTAVLKEPASTKDQSIARTTGIVAAEQKAALAMAKLDAIQKPNPTQIHTVERPERTTLSHAEIASARDLVKDWDPKGVAVSTRQRYDVLNDRMARTGKSPEQIAGTRQSFYTYRAAAVHTARAELKAGLAAYGRAENMQKREIKLYKTSAKGRHYQDNKGWAKDTDYNAALPAKREALKAEAAAKINAALVVLEKYPPSAGDTPANKTRVSAYQGERYSENSNGKRDSLETRNSDWREKVFAQVDQRDKNAVAALALTGARPAELSKGIKVERTKEGASFTIQGAKFGANRGTGSRTISISNAELNKSAEGRHIQEKFAPGKTGTIKANGDDISNKLSLAGDRAELGGDRLSAYDYRHAFSARNKDNKNLTTEERSAAMGHRKADSQSAYGKAGQNGGTGDIS